MNTNTIFASLRTACFAGLLSLAIVSCTSLPPGVEPVGNFDLNGYLGKWYEVARLDHPFERGLEQVTAEYVLKEGGGIKVINRGYSTKGQKWQEIEGVALPVRGEDEGFLKVSFFGPFYSSYCVFELGPKGDYAFVSGAKRSYLWLLARTPSVSDQTWRHFESRAKQLGFDTGNLVRVKHH
jgi:apolipoprotein D and lipocalin family protein